MIKAKVFPCVQKKTPMITDTFQTDILQVNISQEVVDRLKKIPYARRKKRKIYK